MRVHTRDHCAGRMQELCKARDMESTTDEDVHKLGSQIEQCEVDMQDLEALVSLVEQQP